MLTSISMLSIDDQLRTYAKRGGAKRVAALLALGGRPVDVLSTGILGKTALQIDQGAGEASAAVVLLLKSHVDKTIRLLVLEEQLHEAAIAGDHASVERILCLNLVDVDNKNDSGVTALYLASGLGHKKTVEVLVKHGADVCLTSTFLDIQETPMCRAVKHGFVDCAVLLLAAAKGNPFPEINSMIAAIALD